MNEKKIKKLSAELNKLNSDSLMRYKQSGVVAKVEILTIPDSCNHCKKQQGKIYTLDEAIRISPLPCKECNHVMGCCRCTYLPIVK